MAIREEDAALYDEQMDAFGGEDVTPDEVEEDWQELRFIAGLVDSGRDFGPLKVALRPW